MTDSPKNPLEQILYDVQTERMRQIHVEGFSPESDMLYNAGELSNAGGIYALHAHSKLNVRGQAPEGWTWDEKWWKPSNPRRNLIKAIALLVAEVERIDRKSDETLSDEYIQSLRDQKYLEHAQSYFGNFEPTASMVDVYFADGSRGKRPVDRIEDGIYYPKIKSSEILQICPDGRFIIL